MRILEQITYTAQMLDYQRHVRSGAMEVASFFRSHCGHRSPLCDELGVDARCHVPPKIASRVKDLRENAWCVLRRWNLDGLKRTARPRPRNQKPPIGWLQSFPSVLAYRRALEFAGACGLCHGMHWPALRFLP